MKRPMVTEEIDKYIILGQDLDKTLKEMESRLAGAMR